MHTHAKVVAAVVVAMALHAAPAHADDPDTSDDPGFSVGGSTPGQIGVEQWPPVCSTAPLACGLHFNPGPNTWTRPSPEPAH